MAKFIAEKVVKEIIKTDHPVKGCVVNVMGLTFKENCPDLRNSKVADMVFELQSYGVDVHVYDPLADRSRSYARIWNQAGILGKFAKSNGNHCCGFT